MTVFWVKNNTNPLGDVATILVERKEKELSQPPASVEPRYSQIICNSVPLLPVHRYNRCVTDARLFEMLSLSVLLTGCSLAPSWPPLTAPFINHLLSPSLFFLSLPPSLSSDLLLLLIFPSIPPSSSLCWLVNYRSLSISEYDQCLSLPLPSIISPLAGFFLLARFPTVRVFTLLRSCVIRECALHACRRFKRTA